MTRAGHSRLEYLRGCVPLLALAEQFTRMHRYSRAEHVGLCLFHIEQHPSFFVNVETGRFFCHGCQTGGDVFRFVEILCACDFREAVRQVARIGKGKPVSLPPVGLAALPHRCQGVQGGRRPPALDRVKHPRLGKLDCTYLHRWLADLRAETDALPASMLLGGSLFYSSNPDK